MKKLTIETVVRRRRAADLELENVTVYHDREMRDLRERCPHDWKYEGDPSGNNDSGYVCRACGKETRKLP